MRAFSISRTTVAIGFSALLAGGFLLSGCLPNSGAPSATQKTEEKTMEMEVSQVDQFSRLGDKTADGQYVVAKVNLKNLGNETLALNPADFKLENITKEETERYSQPAEKFMTAAFTSEYGKTLKDKVMDFAPTNLYPRMEVERYFVFMLPSEAKLEGYQITYAPANISSPLAVTGTTTINDHRNESAYSSTTY